MDDTAAMSRGMDKKKRTPQEISAYCADYLAIVLDVPMKSIHLDAKFPQLGVDSATSIFLVTALEEWLGLEIAPDILLKHQTVADLARHLAARQERERASG
jgi:macrolactin polyketide synthase MlnE